MNSRGSRKQFPSQPFHSQPLAYWQQQLVEGESLEDRYRGFLALTELLPAQDLLAQFPQFLQRTDSELHAAALNWLVRQFEHRRLAVDDVSTAVLPLVEASLHNKDPDVQLAALRVLSYFSLVSHDFQNVLKELMARDDIQPASLAALADLCGRVPSVGKQHLPFLRSQLAAEQAEVREAAAVALNQLGSASTEVLPALVTALEDEEPIVREAAAQAMGKLGLLPDWAKSALELAMQDEDSGVAAAARSSYLRL